MTIEVVSSISFASQNISYPEQCQTLSMPCQCQTYFQCPAQVWMSSATDNYRYRKVVYVIILFVWKIPLNTLLVRNTGSYIQIHSCCSSKFSFPRWKGEWTPDFVNGPFVALGKTVDLAPSDRFSTFRFRVTPVFLKKKKRPTRQKVSPHPTMGTPFAKQLSAFSTRAA